MNYYERPLDADNPRFKYYESSGCGKFLIGGPVVLIAVCFTYYQIQVYAMEQDKDECRIQMIRDSQERMTQYDSIDPNGPQLLGRADDLIRERFESLATEHEAIVKKHPKWADKYPPIHRLTDDELNELYKVYDEEWERRKREFSTQH